MCTHNNHAPYNIKKPTSRFLFYIYTHTIRYLTFTKAIFFTLFFLAATHEALAFKVEKIFIGPIPIRGQSIHEEITENIRLNRFDAAPPGLYFSQQAVDTIKIANRAVDSKEWDKEEIHFDNDSFIAGSRRLFELSKTIVLLAENNDFLSAQSLLGQALHSVQDFYSHSTWVESGNKDIDPRLGVEIISELTISSRKSDSCDANKLLPGKPLTSGYFSLWELGGNDLTLWTFPYTLHTTLDWPISKCIHGDKGAGLHKDDDSRQPYFNTAKTLATKATLVFVENILEKLKSSGNSNSICGLMTGSVCATQIRIPANSYTNGVNVALGGPNGIYGSDVLLNAPPYKEAANQARFIFYVASEGDYELAVEYAAAVSRPVSIAFNGFVAISNALSEVTGGWLPSNQTFRSQGTIRLPRGYVTMTVSRSNVFPHIRSFLLTPKYR